MKKITTTPYIRLISLLIILFAIFLPTKPISATPDMKQMINDYVEAFLEVQRIPGASIALVHDGEIYYSKSWGITGEKVKEITPTTPFTIGSISKSLTGLGIMKLVEDELIQLDDPVQKHIPWFTLADHEAASQITIQHLLTQTSGISTYVGLSLSDKELVGNDAIKNGVKHLANAKLSADPGQTHQYSNANFLILGALIEEITKQPYATYMEKEVFLPLGMHHAAANKNTAYYKGYQAGYQSWFGFPIKSSITYDDGGAPYGYITASTADMVQYIELLSQNNNNFLSEETLKRYVTPNVRTGENLFYGLGVRISNPNSKEEMIWHSGSTPDSHAEVFYLPESGWGGVILTNKNHILEEEGLIYLKQGIVHILHGGEAIDIPNPTPFIQIIFILGLLSLFVLLTYLSRTFDSKKVGRIVWWRIVGIILITLSIVIIPLLSFGTNSPWHTIKVFAPDLAWLTIFIDIFLAINGVLAWVTSINRAKQTNQRIL